MWKTGNIGGYRWESISLDGKVVNMAVFKGNKEVVPGRLMKLYISIMGR